MLDLSVIKNKCDCCILISGDADFVPASKLIKKSGKEVFSTSLTKGYSFELRKNMKEGQILTEYMRVPLEKGTNRIYFSLRDNIQQKRLRKLDVIKIK